MKKIILIIFLIFLTSQLYAQEQLTDFDKKTLGSVSSHLKNDPVTREKIENAIRTVVTEKGEAGVEKFISDLADQYM